MTARDALRTATAQDHERIDAIYSRFDLARPDDYRRFLAAQAEAHLPVEAALDASGAAGLVADWPERRRASLLLADLAALGAPVPQAEPLPPFPTGAALLGALYVLEGSRLGGAVLKRTVPPELPTAFLGARGGPGAWRKLLAKLDDRSTTPPGLPRRPRRPEGSFPYSVRRGRGV